MPSSRAARPGTPPSAGSSVRRPIGPSSASANRSSGASGSSIPATRISSRVRPVRNASASVVACCAIGLPSTHVPFLERSSCSTKLAGRRCSRAWRDDIHGSGTSTTSTARSRRTCSRGPRPIRTSSIADRRCRLGGVVGAAPWITTCNYAARAGPAAPAWPCVRVRSIESGDMTVAMVATPVARAKPVRGPPPPSAIDEMARQTRSVHNGA